MSEDLEYVLDELPKPIKDKFGDIIEKAIKNLDKYEDLLIEHDELEDKLKDAVDEVGGYEEYCNEMESELDKFRLLKVDNLYDESKIEELIRLFNTYNLEQLQNL